MKALTILLAALLSCGASATADEPNGDDVFRRLALELSDQVRDLRSRLNDQQTKVAQLERTVSQLRSELDQQQQQSASLITDQRSQAKALADVVRQDPGGRNVLRLLGNMQSSEAFRSEVGNAVQGRLNFTNNTGRAVDLYVNGTRWNVIQKSSFIYVPYGKRVSIRRGPKDDPPTWLTKWKFSAQRTPELSCIIEASRIREPD